MIYMDVLSVAKLFILILSILMANISFACDGPLRYQKLNRSDVIQLIKDQELNLCGAQLNGVDLSQLNLSKVNLSQASLVGALLNGSDLSRADLRQTQLRHAKLVKTYFRWANMAKANLSEADASHAIFIDANLEQALFSRANIDSSDFSDANLNQAQMILVKGQAVNFSRSNLMDTNFSLARLSNSFFSYAKADNAVFNEANLSHSHFNYAQLNAASFKDSVLKQVNLSQSKLTNTSFENADLMQVQYFPSIEGLPSLNALTTSRNFEQMIFYDQNRLSAAMSSLQAAYAKAGIRTMERKITSMRKTAEMNAKFDAGGLQQVDALLNYVFFYLTCDFGLAPQKPIFILMVLILVLCLPYYISFGAHSPHAGIVVSWPSRRDPNCLLEASYQHFVKIHEDDPWVVRLIKRQRRMMTAFYFSFLSSVRIGWQDFNLASWFSLIQTKEYHFIAKGWVRSLAGLQSIISAYLIVLWALTYFGNPFNW